MAKPRGARGGADKKSLGSMSDSSQNDEERKEKEQYHMLKQSLKALQERASTTFKGSNSQPAEAPKPYSVSSDNEAGDEDADAIEKNGKPYPTGLISDDSADEAEKKIGGANTSSNSNGSNDLHPLVEQEREMEQSYIQSSENGTEQIRDGAGLDHSNLHNEEGKNIFEEDLALEEQPLDDRKLSVDRKRLFQMQRGPRQVQDADPRHEESKSSQLLTSINERVNEHKKLATSSSLQKLSMGAGKVKISKESSQKMFTGLQQIKKKSGDDKK